jgi:hypothetical protein
MLITTASAQTSNDWKPVETALGRSGSMQPGDVFKVAMPRSDLKVVVNETPIKAGLALGSWLAFKKNGDQTMVMGDLVLTEDEVSPVMLKLQQSGIEETAVHNHLLHDAPPIKYMHISGHGDAVKLAAALKSALALTGTPLTSPAPSTSDLTIDATAIDKALDRKGKNNNGIYQFSIARAETIRDMGIDLPPAMGTATAINFQPTGNGHAAITGDFVLIASEVNPVISALQSGGIEVTAVHNHMLTEQPRLFFMHFWANDDAVKLARGLRAALDKTNSAKP